MQSSYLHVHERDNVIVTLKGFEAGESISHGTVTVTLNQKVPVGHKVALRPIKQGENIIKYGFPIGRAKEKVEAGDWIHTHNVQTNLEGTLEYTYTPKPSAIQAEKKERTFMAISVTMGKRLFAMRFGLSQLSGALTRRLSSLRKWPMNNIQIRALTAFTIILICLAVLSLVTICITRKKNIKQPSASP